MIEFPRRSVTRFFIPLIDVLTLLFCIFLLMPMIKPAGDTPEMTNAAPPDLTPGDAPARANPPGETQPGSPINPSESAKEREELEKLRTDKIDILQQRLFIRVLEIDPDTGKLFYREPDGVREIAS